jgi:hypothetical protein
MVNEAGKGVVAVDFRFVLSQQSIK